MKTVKVGKFMVVTSPMTALNGGWCVVERLGKKDFIIIWDRMTKKKAEEYAERLRNTCV